MILDLVQLIQNQKTQKILVLKSFYSKIILKLKLLINNKIPILSYLDNIFSISTYSISSSATKRQSRKSSIEFYSGIIVNSKKSQPFEQNISNNTCLEFMDTIINDLNNSISNKTFNNSPNEYSEPYDVYLNDDNKKFIKKCTHKSIDSLKKTSFISTSIDEDSAYSSFSNSEKDNDLNIIQTSLCSPSEYELVKDILLIKNDKDLFKSTIHEFDNLSNRCVELIELFDIKNLKHNTDNLKLLVQNNILNKSSYLERNLYFDFYMKSCVLLSTNILVDNRKKNISSLDLIRNLIIKICKNDLILFKNINEFLNLTQISKEPNPTLLMSNIRQFMSGIKNYLLKNNIDLRLLIDQERCVLELNELLNIDLLIEDCLQFIILEKLKPKLYSISIDWFIQDTSLLNIKMNIKYLNDFCKILNLDESQKLNLNVLKQIRNYYNRMQCEYAPLIKLKYILLIINEILVSIKDPAINDYSFLDVKKFLCILLYSFSKCQMYAVQIEIDYIWNLINKRFLNNETIYYIQLISVASYCLVNLNKLINEKEFKINVELSLIEIFYPDDKLQVLNRFFIPVRTESKCKDIIKLISAKLKIYNNDEYFIYIYQNGLLNKLKDDDKLFNVKQNKTNSIKFIFKQKFSNMVWSKLIESY